MQENNYARMRCVSRILALAVSLAMVLQVADTMERPSLVHALSHEDPSLISSSFSAMVRRELSDGRAWVELPMTRRPGKDRGPMRSRSFNNRSLEGYKEIANIHREGDGVYWADLIIGSSTQHFSVIVDTGSSTIAVPCSGCDKCGKHHKFLIKDGAHKTGETYLQCYSEGSCNRGDKVRALMCLGNGCDVKREGTEHEFGCCTTYASAFQTQEADGIIGMSGTEKTFVADLRKHHKLQEDMFSMCLSAHVGVLGIGGYDETRHLEPLQWIKMGTISMFKVKISTIVVGGGDSDGSGKRISIDPIFSPFVDSGTTFTYIPSRLHSQLKAAFNQWCDADKENRCPGENGTKDALKEDLRDSVACYTPPAGQEKHLQDWLEKFPSLELEMPSPDGGHSTLCIPSSTYFFRSNKNAYCVGILNGGKKFILGAISMAGFDMIFDLANKRLGMARAICDKNKLFDPNYRMSRSNCCGSCATAQKSKFNARSFEEPVATISTISPTSSLTVAVTTVSPSVASTSASNTNIVRPPSAATEPPAAVLPTRPKSELTEDGLFHYEDSPANYPGIRILYRPVKGSQWLKGHRAFGDNSLLVIDVGQGMSAPNLCADRDLVDAWTFAPSAKIIIEGEGSARLGQHCSFPHVRIEQASVSTIATERLTHGGLTVPVKVNGTLELGGELSVRPHTFLALHPDTSGLVTISESASLQIQPGAKLTCNPKYDHKDNHAKLMHGDSHLLMAPGSSQCYLFVGTKATISVIPDTESGKPFEAGSSIYMEGTLVMIIERSPFLSYALKMNDTLIWHYQLPNVYRIELDGPTNGDNMVTELPVVARLIDGPIQDNPMTIEFGPDLLCAGTELDEKYIGQIHLSSPACLRKCMADTRSPKVNCTAEEKLWDVWPPEERGISAGANGSHGIINEGFDKFDNSTLAVYYGHFLDKIGLKSDATMQHSTLGGFFGGALLACLCMVAIYPPQCVRSVCGLLCRCCKKKSKTTYEAVSY